MDYSLRDNYSIYRSIFAVVQDIVVDELAIMGGDITVPADMLPGAMAQPLVVHLMPPCRCNRGNLPLTLDLNVRHSVSTVMGPQLDRQ